MEQVDRMSFWEFATGVGGYAKARGALDDTGISEDEAAALAAWVHERPVWH